MSEFFKIGDTVTFEHYDAERYDPYTLTGTVDRVAWHGAVYVNVPQWGELLTWQDRLVWR